MGLPRARRWLARRPRLAAGAIAAVSLLSVSAVLLWGFYVSWSTYTAITSIVARINRAGHQRMLSQRLCLYSPLNPGAPVDASIISSHLLRQFTEHQAFLGRNQSVAPYQEFVRALKGTSFPDVVRYGFEFATVMEEYAMKLEQESKREIERLKTVMRWVTVVTTTVACILGLLGWFFARDQRRLLETEQNMIQYLFHEIRNPLNHVVNGIETVLLDTPSLTQDATQHLRSCREGGELILKLLGDVLNIAKLESGEPLDLQLISVASTCASAVRVSSLSAKTRGVHCKFIQGPGCDGFYLCDGTRLSQALLNLLCNAVKYVGEDGTVNLRLEVTSHSPRGHQLTFTVEDDGPGVREEDKESLFLKFRTFNQNSGAGLGLHLTNIIVRRMGGEIAVTSPAPGCDHGSVFSFSVFMKYAKAQSGAPFPLERVESRTKSDTTIRMQTRTKSDTTIRVQARTKSDTTNPVHIITVPPAVEQECSDWVNQIGGGHVQGHGGERMNALRVLIVDDDIINIRILARKFARDPIATFQWMVDTASSLPECLEKVSTEPSYDILFLDDHFNGDRMTGSAYIKTLRERGMNAAVFMCSANCSRPDVLRYRRLGAVGVLPKPIPNGETLLAVVYKGLCSHHSRH